MTRHHVLLLISLSFASACKKSEEPPATGTNAPAAKPVESQAFEVADFVARVKSHASEWTGKQVTVHGAMAAQLAGDADNPNGGVALGPDGSRVDCDLAVKTPQLDQMSNETITVRGTVQKLELGEITLSDCRVIGGLK